MDSGDALLGIVTVVVLVAAAIFVSVISKGILAIPAAIVVFLVLRRLLRDPE